MWTLHQLRVMASGLKVKFILTASHSVVNHSSASWTPPPNEASRITSSAKTRDNFEVRSVRRARLSLPSRLTVWQNQFEADLKQSRSKAWQNYSHMHGLRSSPSSCLPSGWGHSEPGHLAPDFLPSVWVSGLSPWTSLPARVYEGPKQHTHPSTTVRWVYISFFN